MGNYQIELANGQRTISEMIQFRKNSAADIQSYRYRDMAFRIFRNDALQKYRAQFDLAARYAYLAATAYDYETNLLGSNNAAGREFLTQIVRERALGQIIDGVPVPGSRGLAGPMGQMAQNFDVLKSQLGFNNPQIETNRFSLRREAFRLLEDSDEEWEDKLENEFRVDDLWQIPEFRRYCKPFAPESAGPQPGLVIPFETTVTFGLNFFGWPLGPGDSAYDPSHFVTKIREVGSWFTNYSGLPLSNTPRVYVVPVGADVLRSPSDDLFATREWQVVDQVIPVPFPLGANDLDNPAWIPDQRHALRELRPDPADRRLPRLPHRRHRAGRPGRALDRQPAHRPLGLEPQVADDHPGRDAALRSGHRPRHLHPRPARSRRHRRAGRQRREGHSALLLHLCVHGKLRTPCEPSHRSRAGRLLLLPLTASLLLSGTASARLPEPNHVFYGTAMRNGVALADGRGRGEARGEPRPTSPSSCWAPTRGSETATSCGSPSTRSIRAIPGRRGRATPCSSSSTACRPATATVGERGEVQMLDLDPLGGGLPTLAIGDLSALRGELPGRPPSLHRHAVGAARPGRDLQLGHGGRNGDLRHRLCRRSGDDGRHGAGRQHHRPP